MNGSGQFGAKLNRSTCTSSTGRSHNPAILFDHCIRRPSFFLDEGPFDIREPMTTLTELKPALEQPFPAEAVQFLLKDVRQDDGKWTCLAFPYCNKRVYEDRLNALAY